MERPTFSPFWHRISSSKPRLRPHVQITRQHYRGRRWHVAHDPTSNQFYRLNPVAYELIASLDGHRTVEQVWKQSLTKFADGAPTQNEVLELLGQLYNSNLLSLEVTPETEQLLMRGRDRKSKRLKQQAVGIMYLKLKLFNPDKLLVTLLPFFKPLLNRWGFMAWAALVLYALVRLLSSDWSRLAQGLDSLVAPSNWGYLMVTFVLIKAWHELGHGLICRRYGGQVPEAGVMLLVLMPAPYVDASSCWAFSDKWKRIAVSSGGMIFELAIAAIAALVWLATPDGTLTKQICYFIILTSGVSTILFNANPLMRFDGYFILSDLIGVPNLMQRSNQMLQWLFKRFVYGVETAKPPSTQRGEQWALVIYGVLATLYRLFLFVVITTFILGMWFIVGVILAVWTAVMWFVMPVGKFVHWLASNAELVDKRAKAIAISLVMIAAVLGVVGLVPLPDWRRAGGVIDAVTQSGVYAGTDGFVDVAHKRPGDAVGAGEPILTLVSPELAAQKLDAAGKLKDAMIDRSEAYTKDDSAAAAVAERQIALAQAQIDNLDNKQAKLIVRAPHQGVLVGQDPDLLVGGYISKGTPICQIIDTSKVRVAVTLSQTDSAWLFELPQDKVRVQMRLVSNMAEVFEGVGIRALPGGQRTLPHQALGFGGGGDFETVGTDRTGRQMKKDQFNAFIELPKSMLANTAVGQRVYMRFTLPSKPALEQVIDRINKTLQGKVNL